NAPVTATITATPAFTNGGLTCTGSPVSFDITVNPVPTVNPTASQVLCHLAGTAAVNFTGFVTGTVYNWANSNPSIGLAASGSGDIPSFPATNATNAPVSATITVTPSFTNAGLTCSGNPASFTITVNPIPTVNVQAGQVLCHSANTAAVNFTGNVAGTVYNWVNTNASIGLAAAGTGNIPSFTVTNSTPAPVTATITITPAFTNGGTTCSGTPASFDITVNPIPTVSSVANQVLCNQAGTSTVNFSGNVPGTIYNWVNSNTTIGLGAGGTGDISSFTATNATNSPVTSTVTITPTFTNAGLTCTGSSTTFSITVNPTPTVNAVANQALCHQFSTTAINFSGFVPGTVYSWVNSNTTIGLAASGTGNIASFAATNSSASPVTATITVTPSFTNAGVVCTGLASTFTITVNPLPVPSISGPAAVCLNLPATYSTEDFQFSYLWNVVSGGVISSGQSTRQVDVLWNTIGTHTITVNYTDQHGCTAVLPTSRQIVVNSLPSPTITGATTVCAGDTKTYQTQAGAQSYSWTLPASGIVIVSGGQANDDQVTIKWNVAGVYNISVNYIIGTGCTAPAPTNYGVTVNALPAPQITGSSPVCALSTHNYVLTPVVGGHLYSWTVSGGTIIAGQSASTVQVSWGGPPAGSLNLTETIGYPGISCSAPAATFPVVLNPWPDAAGSITGQNSVCKTSTYTYAVPSIANATSYQWLYGGSGVTITNNGNSTISVTFSATATSGALTVKGVNDCGNGLVSPPLNIAVHNLPEVTFVPCFDIFTTSFAKKIILRGGTPYLAGQGVYAGNRVSLNPLTGFYEFDPSGASAGSYFITYTFTNTFGCLASAPSVTITVQNNPFSCGGNVTDVRDGKIYKTAYLSGRCWMTENLAYGTSLVSPGTPQTDNCIPEKYCAPTDAACSKYGGMYQWDEVMDYAVDPGSKGICPPEWHVPTEVEWQSLIDNLVTGIGFPASNAIAGSTLKDLLITDGFHGITPGFNYNDNYWAFTSGTLTGTLFWTSSVNGASQAISRGLNIFNPSIAHYAGSRGNALSLRCIKD
ncbi:MAG: FISUMP domain-containing protein, partial [Bacteroidota bacterium]